MPAVEAALARCRSVRRKLQTAVRESRSFASQPRARSVPERLTRRGAQRREMRRPSAQQRARTVLFAAAALLCTCAAAQKTTSASVLTAAPTNVVLDWNAQANGAPRTRSSLRAAGQQKRIRPPAPQPPLLRIGRLPLRLRRARRVPGPQHSAERGRIDRSDHARHSERGPRCHCHHRRKGRKPGPGLPGAAAAFPGAPRARARRAITACRLMRRMLLALPSDHAADVACTACRLRRACLRC